MKMIERFPHLKEEDLLDLREEELEESEEEEEEEGAAFDMSEFLTDDEDEDEAEASAEPTDESTGTTGMEETPSETPSSEEPSQTEETPTEETPEETPAPETTSEEETPSSEESPQEPLSQEEWNRQFQEQREKAIGELEQRYALDDETKEQILSEPEKVLPRMAANIFMDAYQYTFREIMGALPNVVQNIQQQQSQQQEREQEFFGTYESLADQEGKQTVAQVAQSMQGQAKNMGKEQFQRAVALQAHVLLGRELPQNLLDGVVPQQQQPAQEEAAPAAPSTSPHKPAGPGSPAGPSVPTQSGQSSDENIFAQLATDDWD